MIIILTAKKHRLPDTAAVTFGLLLFFLFGYFLRAPSLAASSASAALRACASTLIPALFPCIVLVGIMNGAGIPQMLARIVGRPLGWLFGMSPAAAYPILMGALGGFPIGAVCTRELYERGEVSLDEAERLCAFTNNASPAFCIGGIGASLMGDAVFGVKLYLCQLVSAVLIGILGRRRAAPTAAVMKVRASSSVSGILTDAVVSGGLTMLKICSFAVFFAVIGDAVCLVTDTFFGEFASAVAASFFELTLGVRRCAAMGGHAAKTVTAAAVGWSGLSVQMQVSAIVSGSGISMKRCYAGKLISALLCTFLIFLFS